MKASINGTEIFFDVEGLQYVPDGPVMKERPVCFLIHGGPGIDHATYIPDVSRYSNFMQIVYVDNRGSGRSGRPDLATCTLEQNIEDLEALRQYLGLEKIVVMGQSYGGFVSQGYALKYPETVAALILIMTAPCGEAIEDAKVELKKRGTPEQIAFGKRLFDGRFENDEQFTQLFNVLFNLYSCTRKELSQEAMDANKRQIVSREIINNGFQTYVKTFDYRNALKSLNVPTLIIGGVEDWITPVKYSYLMANLINNSELKVFENCGHSVFVDAPDFLYAEIRQFIKKHLGHND